MADRLPAQQSGDAHEDLLATLAASRELGPEMDATLAERYMQKHGQAAQPRQQAAQQQSAIGPQGQRFNPGLAAIGPVLGIAVYVALLIASDGALWWMFWLPMALGGWWGSWCGGWGGYNDRYAQRDAWRNQRRMARDQYRAWRRGYGTPPGWYDEPGGQGGYPPYPTYPPYPPTGDARQQGQPPYGQAPTPRSPSQANRDVL